MLTEHVNGRLREIFEWCNCNKLSLNPANSEFIIVTNKIVVNRPQFFIGADPIKEVDSFKYLGYHVDTRIKFNVQTNNLKDKLSQLCVVSFRLSKFLDFNQRKIVQLVYLPSIILLHRSMGWCFSVHFSLWWYK